VAAGGGASRRRARRLHEEGGRGGQCVMMHKWWAPRPSSIHRVMMHNGGCSGQGGQMTHDVWTGSGCAKREREGIHDKGALLFELFIIMMHNLGGRGGQFTDSGPHHEPLLRHGIAFSRSFGRFCTILQTIMYSTVAVWAVGPSRPSDVYVYVSAVCIRLCLLHDRGACITCDVAAVLNLVSYRTSYRSYHRRCVRYGRVIHVRYMCVPR
jgi:hypothetical protein